MSPLAILGLVLGASGAILTNRIYFMMIDRINDHLPPNERISWVWWGRSIRTRYEQLYPESRLPRFLKYCFLALVLGSVLVGRYWVFG